MNYTSSKVKKAGEVVQSFMTVSRTLSDFTKKNAESLGLTIQQMGILNSLYIAPKVTLKELGDKIHMPKSTLSVSIDELVNLKLVERLPNEIDRRKIILLLTSSGIELAKKSIDNPLSYLAMMEALDNFSENEIEILLKLHTRLLANLNEV